MQDHRVDHNSTIAIKSNDLLVILATLVASSLLGCKWTRVNPFILEKRRNDLTHIFQTIEGPEPAMEDAIVIDARWAAPPDGFRPDAGIKFSGYLNEDHPWILAQTSGTTGTPKFLELSHKVMFDRAISSKDDFVAFETKSVCLFPITAFPYITRALAALVNNCTIVQSTSPAFWVKAGVNLVTASQNQIVDVFADIGIKKKIAALHVGGTKLQDVVALEMLENFEKVVDLYGSTETNRAFKNVKTIGGNGELVTTPQMLDSTIQIVDEDDQEVAGSAEGLIRIRNPHMVLGYLDSPTAQATSFRDGWFYPGDVGGWRDSGALEVVGRTNDQFNIGGVKLNAVSIDVAIISADGVKDAISFTIPNQNGLLELVAFIVAEEGASRKTIEESVRFSCGNKFGKSGVPAKILFANKLPRNANGKPDRAACKNLAWAQRPT